MVEASYRLTESFELDRNLEQSSGLLTPKLRLPHHTSTLVPREILFARLDAGLERKLTLISAPAGYGKTTLASAWAARQNASQGKPVVAWVALDEGDNDPVLFWHYVIAACRTVCLKPSQSSQIPFPGSGRLPIERYLTTLLTELLNELNQLQGHYVLILEDYHLITSPHIHKTLTSLIEHLPPSLHVIILTRSDPPLPLARFRAHGDLCELHADDLRFSSDEVRTFLDKTLTTSLSHEVIQHLTARTEGWAVGMQLMALALQKNRPPQEVEKLLGSVSGSHRHIMEYLVEEVLQNQPEPIQTFLLQTSLLSRLTPPLCDAVTGRADSSLMLARLEQSNLFLQPLDDQQQWYRYHALFAEAMYQKAKQTFGEKTLRTLQSRACRWYEQHTMLIDAVECALAAQEFAHAAALMQRLDHIDDMGGHYTLHRWLEQIPEEVMGVYPRLCFGYAIAILFTRDRHAPLTRKLLEVPLGMAEQAWRAEGNDAKVGEVLSLRALVAHWQDQFSEAAILARQSLDLLPAQEVEYRSNSLILTGEAELRAGNLKKARQLLIEGRACCEASGNMYALLAATGVLGDISTRQGDLHQAASFFDYIYTMTLNQGESSKDNVKRVYKGKKVLDDRSTALLGLAGLAYEWNNLDPAEQQASQVLDIGKKLNNLYFQVHAALILARVYHARRTTSKAQQMLQEHIALTQKPRFLRKLLLEQARIALATGDLLAVQRWAATHSTDTQQENFSRLLSEQEELLIVRLLLVQGTTQKASSLLQNLLTSADEGGRTASVLEIQLLLALAYHAQGDHSQTRQVLIQALKLAQPAGYQRIFLDEGQVMERLLRSILPELHDESLIPYVRNLLQSFVHQKSQSIDPLCESALLTPQELRVLRLIATGRSKPDIANELVVSINTVKTQVKSIYRKLAVSSRKEAYDAARRLHLL